MEDIEATNMNEEDRREPAVGRPLRFLQLSKLPNRPAQLRSVDPGAKQRTGAGRAVGEVRLSESKGSGVFDYVVLLLSGAVLLLMLVIVLMLVLVIEQTDRAVPRFPREMRDASRPGCFSRQKDRWVRLR